MSGTSWMRGVALVLGVAGVAVGCGGDDGSSKSGSGAVKSEKGQIQLAFNPDQGSSNIAFKKGEVAVGQETTGTVLIKNTGDATLTLSSITFTYVAPDGTPEASPALEMREVRVGGVSQPVVGGVVQGLQIPVGGADIEAVVTFHRFDDAASRSGTLTIVSDTRNKVEQTLYVGFSTSEGAAVANISPILVNFKLVKKGDSPVKPVKVTNTGSDKLTISSVLFKGHIDYRFMYQDPNAKTGEALKEYEPGETVAWDPPIVVNPQETATFLVRYTPEDSNPAEGQAVFYTNDAQQPSGTLVTLQANLGGPCIKVNPSKVQFGGKLIGSKGLLPLDLISCGTEAIKISNIQFIADSNPNFSLEFKSLPGFEDNSKPTAEKPLSIPVNNQATLNVIYVPNTKNPLGADGQPVFDKGTIVIESNAFEEKVEIGVSGLGVDISCPSAIIAVQEGEKVIPQTNLHLSGDQSFAPSGAIASWKWTAKQPTGGASVFVPSDTFPNPTFEVNSAGQYSFTLSVWDEAGVKSCVPAEVEVIVVPDEAIHVELLWHTPNDPDETDQGPEAGSDMDLHFIHDAYANSAPDLDKDGKPDGWFDQPFDCFWFNAQPNWGSFDPSIDDDPGLDRDDTDGAGPENLNLNIPENTTYRIGVHYWSDHEYGPSFATLRIYIYSILVFEVTDVKLVNHDMWNAATIDWPSAQVKLVQKGGGYWITPGYQNPFFFQP